MFQAVPAGRYQAGTRFPCSAWRPALGRRVTPFLSSLNVESGELTAVGRGIVQGKRGQDFSVAVNSVFPKDLLTFECADGVVKDTGLFRVTPLRGHVFLEVPTLARV